MQFQSLWVAWRSLLACCLLLISLVACPTPLPDYKLVSLQPATVTPGLEVVAFGIFPDQPRLTLAGLVVPVLPVANGLRFTVPDSVVAGEQPLRLEGSGTVLLGVLSVNPRVDAVLAEQGQIRVTGAGWDQSSLVALNLDGRRLTTTVQADSSLLGLIPNGLSYGAFTVLVSANDRLAEAFTWNRQAGTVTGRVVLPASGQAQVANLDVPNRLKRLGASQGSTLLVQHQGILVMATLQGLVSVTAMPELNVSRLVFKTEPAAMTARGQLESRTGVARVWFETQVAATDGLNRLQPQSVPNSGAGQWHLPLLGLDANWTGSRGEGVVLAVIDSGVELGHPDLIPNLLPGYDFVDNDAIPQDIYGHGTHVAGLMAATGLVEGVASRAKLLPVRVLAERTGFESNVAKGILWAAGILASPSNPHPAQVINLSLGGPDYPPLIDAAIKSALERGVIVVAAAGNDGGQSITQPLFLG